MGRYYKNSVKGQLTRILILTLVGSSVLIYMIALGMFFLVKLEHSGKTKSAMIALQI